MPQTPITYAPTRNTPEAKALHAARIANQSTGRVIFPKESKLVPGLVVSGTGRAIKVTYARFDWSFFLLNGQAIELDGPPHFRLPPRALRALDIAFTELSRRLDAANAIAA